MTEPHSPPTLSQILASFGEVETSPLSRIQAATARAMTRNWTTIPSVTHMDSIDFTSLEATRRRLNSEGGSKLSPSPFLIRAVATILKRHPQFNCAFDAESNVLIQRKYVHIGLAVDTPAGLLVPVIRDCETMTVANIAQTANELAEKARAKKLTLSDMSGGGFTVSALGPLGGTGFTPIVNAAQAAILGVSRMTELPYRNTAGDLAWRSVVPVSLSYDHRVINGADAGRFMAALQQEIAALADNPDRLDGDTDHQG